MKDENNERISRALNWAKERKLGSKQLNIFDREYKKRKSEGITEEKDKFMSYEAVRQIGAYNMITESSKVIAFISRVYGVVLSKEDYLFIIKNYSELKAKYLVD